MKGVNNDNHFIYDDELYPKRLPTPTTLGTLRTPTTPPVILGPPPENSTEGKVIKNNYLDRYKQEILLRIFLSRSDKLFIHCIEQNKSQKSYTMIY